jgi:flagellum-specific ATP synthase
MQLKSDLRPLTHMARGVEPISVSGKVTDVVGTVVEGHMPDTPLGALCELQPDGGAEPVPAEIVGFREDKVLLMPLRQMSGLKPGSRISVNQSSPTMRVGPQMLGRVLDGLGRPIDGGPPLGGEVDQPLNAEGINPLLRPRIQEPMDVGIRAINAMLTIGVGQRVAIMAGSGVGKSVMLGMAARHTTADVNVIGLIGERGRELREFIERDLGPEGVARSVVICATSDKSPLVRIKGALLTTAVAEFFRNRGKRVLLMMDSLTRLAMAQREVGLAIGEPPTSKGYTPSVLALLPRLLERAGTAPGGGAITGLYTVLVEGDDFNDPVADMVRAITDGHIVLARDLASQNIYPAIDLLQSKSRLMNDICHPAHMENVAQILGWLATYQRVETLVNIGAYTRGTNPQIDHAIEMWPQIMEMLRQGIAEGVSIAESQACVARLAQTAKATQEA